MCAISGESSEQTAQPQDLEGTEVCVNPNCGKDTGIPKNLHIEDPTRNDRREPLEGSHYVGDGAGQLCDECWTNLHLPQTRN